MHPFFEFFNRDRPWVDSDSSKWPKEWSKVFFKSYPRLSKVKLPAPRLQAITLNEAILKRESDRNFSGKPIKTEDLSNLLFYSAGIVRGKDDGSRRAYPSGGARYPLEIYPIVLNVKNLNSGIYHYNVKKNFLELISGDAEELEILKGAFRYPFVKNASLIIVFSMIPWRSAIKYGNFALKIGLIESGHLGQNVYLMAQAFKLKCCALGGFNEELVHKIFEIDGINEIAFYAIAIGK